MTIREVFEIYRKQMQDAEEIYPWHKPTVLNQFRAEYSGFNKGEVALLIEFLQEKEKKWFVANLLDAVEFFPDELLTPMLRAAVEERDPSNNKYFIIPCRRVFDHSRIISFMLELFKTGNKQTKIGVLRSFYWTRPTVYERHLIKLGENGTEDEEIFTKGKEIFTWSDEHCNYEEGFEEDLELFNKSVPRQDKLNQEKLLVLINEFKASKDIELKYYISLALPDDLGQFPQELKSVGQEYLEMKNKQGIAKNWAEFERTSKIKSSFLRKWLLGFLRRKKKGGITLKIP